MKDTRLDPIESPRRLFVLAALVMLGVGACATGDGGGPTGDSGSDGGVGAFEGEFAVSATNVRVDRLTGDFADALLVAQGTSGSCQSRHDFVQEPVLCLGFDLEYEATYQATFGEAKTSGAIQLEDGTGLSESVSCGGSECTVGQARLVATGSGFELVFPEPNLDENDRALESLCDQAVPEGERREAITVIEQDANSIRSFSYATAVGEVLTRGEACAGTYLIIYDRVLTRSS